jgi:hypothetical protein
LRLCCFQIARIEVDLAQVLDATTLQAAGGRLIPFNANSPAGSTFTAFSTLVSTRGLMRICPGLASSHNREATFDTVPMAALIGGTLATNCAACAMRSAQYVLLGTVIAISHSVIRVTFTKHGRWHLTLVVLEGTAVKTLLILGALGLFLAAHGVVTAMTIYPQLDAYTCDRSNC